MRLEYDARLQAIERHVGPSIFSGSGLDITGGEHSMRAGTLTIGSLLMIMAYIAQVYQPLQVFTGKATDLQVWLASLERAFMLLDQSPEIAERESARTLPSTLISCNWVRR